MKLFIGKKVIAFTAYKHVPSIKCKFQPVTINTIEGDLIGGLTEKGKQVYFMPTIRLHSKKWI